MPIIVITILPIASFFQHLLFEDTTNPSHSVAFHGLEELERVNGCIALQLANEALRVLVHYDTLASYFWTRVPTHSGDRERGAGQGLIGFSFNLVSN